MTKNELFRIVGPDDIERVISFDSLAERFHLHLAGNIQPTASYDLSPGNIKEMVGTLEKNHFGAEILPLRVLKSLEEKFNEFVQDKPWKDIQKFRAAIQEFDEFQKDVTPVPA